MNLHEYQAKSLFQQYGIPTPSGVMIDDLNQLPDAWHKSIPMLGC